MGKTIGLDELSQLQLQEDKSRAELGFRELEGQFWDAWRWRRRIRSDGKPHLPDVRREVALAHIDLLFRYIEHQRTVIHQLLAVCGTKEGQYSALKLYNELLEIAGRYDLDGKLIRPTRKREEKGDESGNVSGGPGPDEEGGGGGRAGGRAGEGGG